MDAVNPHAIGRFWAPALGYVEEPPPAGFNTWPAALEARGVQQWDDYYAAMDPERLAPRVYFQRVPEPRSGRSRLHLDAETPGSARAKERPSAAAVRALAGRLVEAGATLVREFDDPVQGFWIVMKDPEGNEFYVA